MAEEPTTGSTAGTGRSEGAEGAGSDASRPCMACRGTGRVTSNLGGTGHEVTCPWCDGGGVFLPGHDAQAARRGEDENTRPSEGEQTRPT